MLQITKEYIERVHLDSARGGNHAAIDLISSAWRQPRGKTFQVDLRNKASRKELLSGAEAYSADPYPNKEWSNRISKEAQSIFQAINRWELKQEAKDCPRCEEKLSSDNRLWDSITENVGQSDARFDGDDYNHERDSARLTGQIRRVYDFMLDGAWRTLNEVSDATGDPHSSVSAQLRNLRKKRFGGHNIERKYVVGGLYSYRLEPGPRIASFWRRRSRHPARDSPESESEE